MTGFTGKIASAVLAPAIVAAAFAGGAAHAHGGVNDKQPTLFELARRAPLIVHGEVVDVAYRNSEPNDQEPRGVPHTFVTYKVRDTIRGRSDGTVTLRFIGGADGRGGVYMETTTPTFARGQTDILFIKGGAQDDCPLVACVDGRFRVAGDRVYNGWGVPVVEAGKNLVIGGALKVDLLTMELPRPPFDALIERPEMKAVVAEQLRRTPMAELRKRYEQEAPERTIVGYAIDPERGAKEPGAVGPPIRKFGEAMRLDDFLAAVKAASAQVPPSRERPVLADPAARIVVASPKLATMAATAAVVKRTPEEQREYESFNEAKPGRPTIDPRRIPVPGRIPGTPVTDGGQP